MSGLTRLAEHRDHDWRDRAACRSVDPELFFPRGRSGAALHHAEAAKAVCRTCPVRAECLEYALSTQQEDGIWGGLSEDERRPLRGVRTGGQRPVRKGPSTLPQPGDDRHAGSLERTAMGDLEVDLRPPRR